MQMDKNNQAQHKRDLDELLTDLGTDAFRELLEKGMEEAQYYVDAVIDKEDRKEALREIAGLDMESDKDIFIRRLAHKYKDQGVTVNSLREDLKTVTREEANKDSQPQVKLKADPIDLLTEPKTVLHPAMDFIDENLIYGTENAGNQFFIHDHKVLDLSFVSKKYSIPNPPRANRFSPEGIKSYVSGGEVESLKLYAKILNLLRGHVLFKEHWQPHLIAIWIFGTYLYRCFPLYPYLWIQSPTKRCGKTRLLELLSELCFNSGGIQTAPSEAVLYRLPAVTAGALCWDEAENLHNSKEKGERLSILNVAYREGGKVSRCVGENNIVTDFEVYRPIALAGISHLPDTVADRSLKIELIRKRRDEKVKKLQVQRLQTELQALRDELYIFGLERASIIMEFYHPFDGKLIPDHVDDRLRDAFEVLISIAKGICHDDKLKFKPLLLKLQEASNALSGTRTSDESEESFIKAVSVLKAKLEENKKRDIIIKAEAAVKLFKKGGLEWVVEPKQARGLLRKLGFRSGSHRKGKVIRSYRIAYDRVLDLSLRYGGGFAE